MPTSFIPYDQKAEGAAQCSGTSGLVDSRSGRDCAPVRSAGSSSADGDAPGRLRLLSRSPSRRDHQLRWEDLDLEAVRPATGELRPVCRVTPHGNWQPKDGEARTIPILGSLLEVLRQHRQAKGYLLQADQVRAHRKEGAVWAYRYDPRKVWLRINAALKAAGRTPITMYGMRHSFASNLLIAGVSDVKVSRWLGHSDTRMLHRHYRHLLSYDDDINAARYETKTLCANPDRGVMCCPAGDPAGWLFL